MNKIRKTRDFKWISYLLVFLFIFQADLLLSISSGTDHEKQLELAKNEFSSGKYRDAQKRLERLLDVLAAVKKKSPEEKRILKEAKALLKDIRKIQKKKNIITKVRPKPPKKKKFPVLLAVFGVAVAAAAAVLLLKKEKKSEPEPQPQTGSIRVESTPDGADIWLNGNNTGIKTNANLDNVSPGQYKVKLIKAGYADYEASVNVVAGEQSLLRITLEPDTPPTVRFIYPRHGEEVKGKITVTVEVTDEIGVNRVEFYIDDIYVFTDSTVPYEYVWDTRAYSNGPHSLEVVAYDTSGKRTEVEIRVRIDN